jgi:(E)-4-hydroxy-3-methylbut-2-enyl-diphosphate synthase
MGGRGGGVRRTVAVGVGAVTVGGGARVSVQSMTKTDTRDVAATLRQLRALARAGCEIGRVAVPDHGALPAFARIRERTPLPLVADIHFDHRLAIACIDAGADKVRINPGNIGGTKRLQEVARRARERGCAIRVGVNAGSLEKDLFAKHGGTTPAALVESAVRAVHDLEAVDFRSIVVSLKASSVPHTIAAYRLASRVLRYPLHLGVTEAGFGLAGIVKSAVGMGALLADGIGDTMRVSLTASPLEEVRVAREILASLGLRREGVEIISCPTCGRCGIDLRRTAREVRRSLADISAPLTVAVMGCPVNGPGEAKAADVGLAGGRGKAVIFSRGRVLKTVPESRMIAALTEAVREEAARRASEGGRE